MILTLSGVRKSYTTAEGLIEILKGVDLQVASGESVALTGESGSGKSTLLHLAGCLDRADSGSIVMNGRDIRQLNENECAHYRRTQVGLVFQQFNLIPSLTVAANISFHAKLADRFDPAWEMELIGKLGLRDYISRYPEQLSGGQQQRVAIGRTLAARPPLILADEPTGNLDEQTGDRVLDLMVSLSRTARSALLLVTHSARLAGCLDRIVVLRGGKIVE
ncbi:ABC transporter ATP-binding protein (plasmid) [Rhizobium leguminosarum]|uniref:ABC transporter ATP-binding protein n=1 Tax=Rhizobium leguminosarum TaxID=384 RepID=UPI00103190CC|nr:ABC transporter ATP-binding protein [Rhizobium leguminosarum]MBY5905434.1 ABC transporter ATP-binding protein [Rhizobium leguminosarum]MBY5912525.1 ABC transporter ATP-binding protein [Rhizobium leguminosarum]MDV4161996.1 ABC transporter ATP-binding protein [Rhizobium leguminosarum]MDV4172375.1 ABC transporter ATP-binding protein [Rhizobium leguminosarum]NKK95882.1 ATP-binding cassette domain-containing protein [Rhizobium leguminosarum bv. viciae]